MRNKFKKTMFVIVTVGILAVGMTGCGDDTTKTNANAAQESASEKESAESEKNSGTVWNSANEKIAMTLPDETWKAETDTEMSMTLKSETGTINIVCYEGGEMVDMMVPTTSEEYQSMVSGGSGDTAVEVVEFKYEAGSGNTIYQGVMNYQNEENPYHYLIHYGIYDSEGGYTATGIVNSNDVDIMETVKTSVYSMHVTQ